MTEPENKPKLVRLSAIRVNPAVRQSGEWVDLPGDEFQGVRVLTRGFTDAYTDARGAALRRAAMKHSNDPARVPNAVQRALTIDAMISHCLSDVEGLADDDGAPISFADFCAALQEPGYEDLYVAVVGATAQAGRQRAAAVTDAAGN